MNNHIAFLNRGLIDPLQKFKPTIELLKSVCSEMDSLIKDLYPKCKKPSIIDCCEHVFDEFIKVDNAKNTLKYYFFGIRYVFIMYPKNWTDK